VTRVWYSVWYSIAATAVAVPAALFMTTGTALAATPSPASAPAPHLADHHDHHGHHHFADESDDYWHVDTDHADSQEILNDYFGYDSNTYGSSASTYLACPPAPGPGVSRWSCSQRPVPRQAR
jgi:hypothetical protein